MHIAISARHGSLSPEQQTYMQEKAEKLKRYFNRLMGIEVEAELRKNGWQVGVFVSAEHKHDFVAHEEAPTPELAMDACVHKVEHQLRRYKEKVQYHRDATPHGGTSVIHPELPEAPDSV